MWRTCSCCATCRSAEERSIEDLERIPRAIVNAPRAMRIAAIVGLFVAGGALIYFMAEPFLASLLALSAVLGIPNFVFVQWVAPFVSEFPEKVSAFYWARTVDRSSMALMNMVSSNINQWTLLAAMLPITYSLSRGVPSAIPLDGEQQLELLHDAGAVAARRTVPGATCGWSGGRPRGCSHCGLSSSRFRRSSRGPALIGFIAASYPPLGHRGLLRLVRAGVRALSHGTQAGARHSSSSWSCGTGTSGPVR